jgi:hypothetical protein
VLADHLVVDEGLVDGREVLALEVLDDRDLEGGLVVDLLDQGRDDVQAGALAARQRRSPAISW